MKTLSLIKIYAIILLLSCIYQIEAQVNTYKFEVEQRTYQALTNPTILYSGNFYNKVSDAIMIQSFKFNGKYYDSLYLVSNGFLSFGPFKPDNTYYPLSQYMFDEGIIAGFGNGLVNQGSGMPQIAYKMVGNEMVFEWKDMKRFNTAASEKVNFQIRLNYSDYSIKIVYGVMTPALYNFNTQQVGIRGNNYNDYLNLEIDGTNNWNNPRIGKTNKAISYFNSDKPTTVPQSGLTYIFTPSNVKVKCLAETNNPFDMEHFGPTNNIRVIVEEGNYLWVGSPGGLLKRHKATGQIVAKYDVSNGLPSNKVVNVAIDNMGNKWVSCRTALAMYDGKDWTIYNEENTQGKLNTDIGALAIDWNGNLWIASYWSGRIVKYDGQNWTVYNSTSNGICSGRINDIEFDPYNNMWIAGENGYTVFDGKDWTCYDTSNSGIADNYVADIFYNNDTVWFATKGGVSFYTGTSWGTYTAANSGLHTNDINSIVATPNGDLWIGTWGYGVYKFDRSNWTRYHESNSDLSDNVIGPMLVDGQGRLWLGTYTGLNKYFNNTFTSFIQNKEIAGSWVVDILPDKTGALWFITHEGISKYDQGQWETHKIGLWFGQAVFENDSTLLIISGEGVIDFNINSFATSYINLGSTVLLDIQKDNSGNIWCTFDGEGVKVFNGTSWTIYNTSNSNLPHDIVTGVDIDNSGNLWFSTHAGVAKFNGSTWTVYTKSAFGGNTDEINDIGVAYNGDILISPSWGGVAKFDGINWARYTKVHGLISSSIDKIYCQKDTNLMWFCSFTGISRYDGTSFVNYSSKNGLTEEGVNNVYIHNNQIWLATQAGASKLEYKKANVDFFENTACYPDKTFLSSVSCFTDPSTKYEWDIDNDGNADYFSKNIEHSFSTYGIYQVNLSVINGNKKQILSKNVTVGLRPSISLTPDNSLNICSGDSQTLSTTITNYNSQFTYDYYWNTNDSVSNIRVSEEGNYKVRVGINECYSDWDSFHLYIMTPNDNAEICMVTVDPTTGKNLVIWEREGGKGIESYNIYKLFGNTYSLIGNMPFNNLSVFIDYNSSPDVKAARYAITVIDTCGNESPLSPYHQTIQLGASEGTKPNTSVLDWTPYIDESNVFQPNWYYIYKGSTPANLNVIDSVSSSFTEWNDTNATGPIYYQVTTKKPDLCYPAILRGITSGGPYSQSLSNLKDYGINIPPYLNISPRVQSVPNITGASATYNVFTNIDSFKVKCNESWVSISINPYAKFFIVTTNSETQADRTASISVEGIDVNSINVQFNQFLNVGENEANIKPDLLIFPNPYSGKTNIEYQLTRETNVAIKVFNVIGKEIKTVVDDLQQTGKYHYEFSASELGLGKGIYLIRFQFEDAVLIKKVVEY